MSREPRALPGLRSRAVCGWIAALEELDQISRAGLFLDVVRDSAVAPLDLVQRFVDRPVRTVKTVPASVASWFR